MSLILRPAPKRPKNRASPRPSGRIDLATRDGQQSLGQRRARPGQPLSSGLRQRSHRGRWLSVLKRASAAEAAGDQGRYARTAARWQGKPCPRPSRRRGRCLGSRCAAAGPPMPWPYRAPAPPGGMRGDSGPRPSSPRARSGATAVAGRLRPLGRGHRRCRGPFSGRPPRPWRWRRRSARAWLRQGPRTPASRPRPSCSGTAASTGSSASRERLDGRSARAGA